MRCLNQPVLLSTVVLLVAGAAGSAGTGPSGVLRLSDVEFPHELHAVDLAIECKECHHEAEAPRVALPHPELFSDSQVECASCHDDGEELSPPRACSNCHDPSPAAGVGTLSAKAVLHHRCWSCHETGAGVAASSSCATCHPSRRIEAGMPEEGS